MYACVRADVYVCVYFHLNEVEGEEGVSALPFPIEGEIGRERGRETEREREKFGLVLPFTLFFRHEH